MYKRQDLQDHGSFWGYNYLGTDDILTKLYSTGVHNAAIGVGNKLNNTVIKQKIFNNLITIGFKLPVIKGQNVIVHKGVTLGKGVILRDGAIIQSNCKIGDCVMIGDNRCV